MDNLLSVCPMTPASCIFENLVHVGPYFKEFEYAKIGRAVFKCKSWEMSNSEIKMNAFQRKFIQESVGNKVKVEFAKEASKLVQYKVVEVLFLELESAIQSATQVELQDILPKVTVMLTGQVLSKQSKFVYEHQGSQFTVTVQNDIEYSMTGPSTVIKIHSKQVTIGGTKELFVIEPQNIENIGIGGLDDEFLCMFQRVFASRSIPSTLIQKMGIKHVKGVLLHGPPGTGKTLLARQIGNMLKCVPPIVVNGPEILNKYVGQSEENIRNLFSKAEKEFEQKGQESNLHLIIFDEIDAICKQRGSTSSSSGVGDSIVNQLLSKIDGVKALENVLLIGMTNRKDLIDDALLRPGRFEVQIELSLPDQKGREQILRIHTKKMRENKILEEDVNLESIAERTKNYSGAELEGLIKAASSYSIMRNLDLKTMQNSNISVTVTASDFERAMRDLKPAFGSFQDDWLNNYPIISYGKEFDEFLNSFSFANEKLQTLLLSGISGSGKTAIAVSIAKKLAYPYTRMITPESMVGYSETAKVALITKIFEDSYKSPQSCIVLDNIERLIEYVDVGPRFSNSVLQCLLVLLKKCPPKSRVLHIVATSALDEYKAVDLGLDCFDYEVVVPVITNLEQKMNLLESFDWTEEKKQKFVRSVPNSICVRKFLLCAKNTK